MRMKVFCLSVLMCLAISLQAQTREVAITIDDLPLNGEQFEPARIRRMTDNFLAAIKKHQIPAVGFVNEGLLYRNGEADARIAILKQWLDGGVELGNHTFSHLGFNNASLADFEDDFIRGDAVTRLLMKPNRLRYFRHPFLQQGKTAEDEKAFAAFLSSRGYQGVPVTVSTEDWMIVAALTKARSQGDEALVKRIGEEYVKFVAQKFDYSDQVAQELFGRPIKHIVLMHANELTAENLDALAVMLKGKGYKFISVEQALQDPVYQLPDKYLGTSDRLGHWAFSKGKKLAQPQPSDLLRQPYLDNQTKAAAQSTNQTKTEKKMYGLIGKMTAVAGKRDELIAILLEGVNEMPGCLSYVVARDPADANAIWITEVWDSAQSHQASLSLPVVRQAITRAKPLIASFSNSTTTEPVGGHGLPNK